MAQYDGVIRIVTKITTKDAEESLASLEYVIKKSAKYMDELRAQMDALKGQKIPTEEYKKLEKGLSDAEKELSKLIEKQNEWEKLGITSGGAWETLNEQIAKASDNVDSIKAKMQQLADAGKSFTLGEDTAKYKAMERQLKYEEDAIARYGEHYKKLVADVPEQFSKMRDSAKKSLDALNPSFLKAGSVAKKAFSGMKDMAKKAFSAITGGAKKSGGLFSALASRFKGIMLTLLIFQWISKAFNAMIAGMKQGFENLAGYSNSYAQSVQSMKNAMSTLGNSFAAAFAPIVQMVIPWLNQLIGALSTAISYVGQFIAALTGASTFTRAKKIQDGYNKSLEGTAGAAKKAAGVLAKFDDLDVLQIDKGGAVAAVTQPKDMFEEVALPDTFKNMADMFKDMWANADFAGLGADIGEWLKNALDSIPWHGIREKARKLGESLATLLNGFIEVPGLGYEIGSTLAQALNAAFEFLNGFVHRLSWDSVGTFIAEAFNGFFGNIDWNLIKDTFVTGFRGFATAINSFIARFEWDNLSTALSNLTNTLSRSIYTFFSTVKWDELGKNLGEQLVKTIKGIDWVDVGKALGSVMQSALDFLISFAKEMDMQAVAQAVIDTLKGFFEVVDIGDLTAVIGTVIMVGLGAQLAAAAAGFVFNNAAKAIIESLTLALIDIGFADFALALVGGVETAVAAIAPPLAIGVAAIGAIGIAIAAMEQDIKRETELEVFGGKLDDITDKIHDQTEAIKNRAQASMDYAQNAGAAEASMAQDLADKYFNLADKENKTNQETEEMQRLAELLVKKYPELVKYYNDQTGLIDTTRKTVDELIQSRLKEIQLNAVEQALTKQYEEQANQLLVLQDAVKTAGNAQERMNELTGKYDSLVGLQQKIIDYENLSAQLNSGVGDADELLRKMQELEAEIQKEYGSFPTLDQLATDLVQANQDIQGFKDEYEQAMSALAEPKAAYDAIGKNITELTAMLTTGMTDAAGYAAKGYSDKMASDTSMKNSTLKQADDLLAAFEDSHEIHSPSKKFEEFAMYDIEGYINGIEQNKQSVLDVMKELALSMTEAFSANFGAEKWTEIGATMFNALMAAVQEFRALWLEAFTVWGEENATLFFGYDKWYETGTQMFAALLLAVEEFKALWNEAFALWNEENILLYFGYDTWLGQWNNMLLAYTDMNTRFLAEWQKNMKLWWDTMVMPYFTVKQWTEFGTNMKNGIVTGFRAIVAQIGGILNSVIDLFNQAMSNIAAAVNAMIDEINRISGQLGVSSLQRISASTVSRLQIPALASGAVIRGGNPFMAILGDQPRGQTNIEAPLATIEKAVENAMARNGYNNTGNVQLRATLNLNGAEVGELLLDDIFAAMKRQGYDVDILGVT